MGHIGNIGHHLYLSDYFPLYSLPYNRKYNVLSASLNNIFHSFIPVLWRVPRVACYWPLQVVLWEPHTHTHTHHPPHPPLSRVPTLFTVRGRPAVTVLVTSASPAVAGCYFLWTFTPFVLVGCVRYDLKKGNFPHYDVTISVVDTFCILGNRFFITVTDAMWREREREMFYLTTHSTHFIYGYMASDIWLRTILIVRVQTRCRHIGYSFRLAARVLLYAPSHRQDSTYHDLCYTSRGALAGTRNSSMGPPHEGSIRRPTRTMSERSTSELRPAPFITVTDAMWRRRHLWLFISS